MQGTSMSSPFAAGAVALMLQANPDLTSVEARDILIETATKDDKVNNAKVPVQWGAGKINVLEAVKKAYELGSGVEDVVADADNKVFVSTVAQNQFEVTYIGAGEVNATLYSIAGQAVVNVSAQGETAVVDASTIASGVYVLTVEADGAKYTTKVVVK
jgi:subtilisin family serine protease